MATRGSTRYWASRAFRLAIDAAHVTLKKRIRVLKIVREVWKRIRDRQQALGSGAQTLTQLARLVQARVCGRYTGISWSTMAIAMAALIYFLNPLDAIPDSLAIIGFTDDISVAAFVARSLSEELDRFQQWLTAQHIGQDLPWRHAA